MQKLTIIFEDSFPCSSFKTKLEKEGDLNLEETLLTLEAALKAAGYCFEGKLTITQAD
tara:strand:+ start:453 stop:626 length:174 start_codon:yes stop_codon:yes gene_type:complete